MRAVTIGFIGATLTLALAVPSLAQAPGANPPASTAAPPAAAAPPSAAAPSAPMAGKKTGGPTRQSGSPAASAAPAASPAMAGKKTGGHARHHYGMRRHPSGMSEAERLNAQELTRLRMGSPAAVSTTPGGNNPTSGSAGPFAPR